MDSDEKPESGYNINEDGFPFTLVGANRFSREITSWNDLSEFIESRPNGLSVLSHVRSYHVAGKKKPILFSSLTSPLVYPYFAAYAQSTAKWNRSNICSGEFRDQPHILIEALSLIESEINRLEQKRIQLMRRQQAEAARKANCG